MPDFRKKPIVIEAEQWFSGTAPRGVCTCIANPEPHVHPIHEGGKQTVRLEPGDWILPEPNGQNYYPCKPDIFAANYEPASEAAPPPYRLAVEFRRLLTPPLVCPGEHLPRLYAADSLLVQMVLGKAWPSGKFSLVEVDGHAVALVEETPVAVLPIDEWRRMVIDYVAALKVDETGMMPGHVVIELSALAPKGAR